MKITQNAHGYCYKKTGHIKSSAKLTESLIKRNFEILHQQLKFEEEAMMEELKLEQELQTIKEEFQKINEYIAYLSSIIRDLEQTLESSDVGFLQTFQDNLKGAEEIPGLLDSKAILLVQESHVHLSGYEKPKQVRVKLDMNEGQVTFSDPQSDIIYYTFTHSFREKVFQFFHSVCREPLRVLPVWPNP